MNTNSNDKNKIDVDTEIRKTISKDAEKLYNENLPLVPSIIYTSDITQIIATGDIKMLASTNVSGKSIYINGDSLSLGHAIIAAPIIYIQTNEFFCANSYIEAEKIFIWHLAELFHPIDDKKCAFSGKIYGFNGEVHEIQDQLIITGETWELEDMHI